MATASTRDIVYLAALLHDIGKFWQRADPDDVKNSQILDQDIKNLENTLCPIDPNDKLKTHRMHKHVLWTAQFFKVMKGQILHLINSEKTTFTIDYIMKLSAAHHNPDRNDRLQVLIQKADHYSSGIDRSKEDSVGWKDAEDENDIAWDRFRRIKLKSIFEGVDPNNAQKGKFVASYKHKLPVGSITLDESFFPVLDDHSLPDYTKLWNDFINEVKFIEAKTFKAFSETLLSLLEKYTSRIPSSTQDLPDVSLFDHSKTVAAFAVCLFDFMEDQPLATISSQSPFLLVGGDLSGIQKFIYGIIARGAAKNLKGRSFYLQLLVDNIVRKLLDSIQLFDANIVYASGGGFYFLAANTESNRHLIDEIEKEISAKLVEFHGTELFLALSSVSFGEQELFYQEEKSRTVGDLWRELSENIGVKKGKKFKNLISENFDYFFIPKNEIGNINGKDAITGEDLLASPSDKNSNQLIKKLEGENKYVNAYTYQQIDLGKKLKNTAYWIQSKEPLLYLNEKDFQPINLGYYNYFIQKEAIRTYENQLKNSAESVKISFFNKENFLEPIQKGIDNIYGFTFYGGNDYPESNWYDNPKVFEELCGVEFGDQDRIKRTSAPDLVRMGILRMDVDRLGSIFQRGFSPTKQTFSRFSTLSRSLDYFFKGYLNQIWSNNPNYKQYTQIIYSGGDDLFIVGKWDILAQMAVEINTKFRMWTCNSPVFTLSGGVAIVGPKFPLLKAALLADSYEKKAKDHQYGEVEKNAFSLFGYNYLADDTETGRSVQEMLFSFNWDDELPFVIELKNEISYLLDKGLSKGFPSAMYNLMERGNFKLSGSKYLLDNFEVIWQAAYSFKRANQATNDDEIKEFLRKWSIQLITHDFNGNSKLKKDTRYHPLQLLALASRWASLEKRSQLRK